MQRTKKPKTKSRSLGSLEEMEDPGHLPKVREKHREQNALEGYCELLETQINSLVDKVLNQSKPHDLVLYHTESDCYFLGGERDRTAEVEFIMTTNKLMKKLPELL